MGILPYFGCWQEVFCARKVINKLSQDAATYHVLFRVVGRICQNTEVKTASDSIATVDNNAMFVRFHKFIIKQYFPLGMENFSATVSD